MRSRKRTLRKEVILALSLISLSLIFPLPGSGYLKGDVDSDDKISLTEAINALQVVSEARSVLSSKTINVPGDIPTIQQAIDSAAEGDTISIEASTYNEALYIDKNRITLQGAGNDSTIVDGGGQDVIVIQGGTGVTIKTLMVRSGKEGIFGKGGAAFEVRDVIVQDCSSKGIQVYENSTAQIEDSTVLRSGADGIFVIGNSSAVFSGTVTATNNTRDGLNFNTTSSGFFYNATVTASNNGSRGILVANSSSLISVDSTVTLQNNTSDGVCALGASALNLYSGTWITENNTRRGLAVIGSSWVYLRTNCSLTSRQNKNGGMQVTESSNSELSGTALLENNVGRGLLISVSASVGVTETASITVKGTQGVGVLIQELATLRAWGGSIVVENSTGSNGYGIWVLRSSNVTLTGSTMSAKIRNNERDGLGIYQHSNGRFDPGTEITGNGSDGLSVQDNSGFFASGIKVQSNSGWGVVADDGSTANLLNSTITENASGDVALRFGSRGTLNGNTIGSIPISCDGIVLSRGTHVCP